MPSFCLSFRIKALHLIGLLTCKEGDQVALGHSLDWIFADLCLQQRHPVYVKHPFLHRPSLIRKRRGYDNSLSLEAGGDLQNLGNDIPAEGRINLLDHPPHTFGINRSKG
ncbi:hypothetical protein SDC9_207129 [bioreactor metagenome]|uniref:Uncharacterized protein n=1 Tax=bioreactor metagenome TaxID=1076179 RepID=A0A645J6X4_9ZZZZ